MREERLRGESERRSRGRKGRDEVWGNNVEFNLFFCEVFVRFKAVVGMDNQVFSGYCSCFFSKTQRFLKYVFHILEFLVRQL